MVPVNLVGDIAEVGFDYNMSAKKVANEVVTRAQTLWDKTIILPEKPATINLKPSEREIMAAPYKPFLPELATGKTVAKVEPEKKKAGSKPESGDEFGKKTPPLPLPETPDKKDTQVKQEQGKVSAR